MPGIKVRDGEPIDKVLRIFKKQVEKAGVIGDLKKGQHGSRSLSYDKERIASHRMGALQRRP